MATKLSRSKYANREQDAVIEWTITLWNCPGRSDAKMVGS